MAAPSSETPVVVAVSAAPPPPPSFSPPPLPPPPTLPPLQQLQADDVLSRLPDELFVLVLSFLPAAEVARAALVSRDVAQRTANAFLWTSLFLQDFDVAPADLAILHLNPRRCYVQRSELRRRRLLQIGERRLQERAQLAVAAAQRRLGVALGTLNTLAWLATPFPLALAFVVILALKLDGDAAPPWAAVFAPVWCWLALALASVAVAVALYVLKRRSGPQGLPELSAWRGQLERLAIAPPVVAIQVIFDERPRAVAHGCLLCVSVALVPVMVALKLAAVWGEPGASPTMAAASWAATLWPLWLAAALLPLAYCAQWVVATDREARIGFTLTLLVLVLPFIAAMATLAASLDGSGSGGLRFSLFDVFAPFWTLNAIVALLLLCHCGVAVGRLVLQRNAEDLAFFAVFLVIVSALLLPPLVTLVLVAQRTSGPIGAAGLVSWKHVLAPMIFWFTVASAITTAMTGGAVYQQLLRPWAEARRREADLFGSEAGLQIIAAGRVVVASGRLTTPRS